MMICLFRPRVHAHLSRCRPSGPGHHSDELPIVGSAGEFLHRSARMVLAAKSVEVFHRMLDRNRMVCPSGEGPALNGAGPPVSSSTGAPTELDQTTVTGGSGAADVVRRLRETLHRGLIEPAISFRQAHAGHIGHGHGGPAAPPRTCLPNQRRISPPYPGPRRGRSQRLELEPSTGRPAPPQTGGQTSGAATGPVFLATSGHKYWPPVVSS